MINSNDDVRDIIEEMEADYWIDYEKSNPDY